MTVPSRRPRVLVPPVPPADITVVFDGGSLGNPGKGYGSFVIRGAVTVNKPVRLDFEGTTTNNEAEYLSMIHALRLVTRELERNGREPSETSVAVLSDSKLVVEQVNGRWKVRHEGLKPLYRETQQLLSRFKEWHLQWQPRVESVRLLGH